MLRDAKNNEPVSDVAVKSDCASVGRFGFQAFPNGRAPAPAVFRSRQWNGRIRRKSLLPGLRSGRMHCGDGPEQHLVLEQKHPRSWETQTIELMSRQRSHERRSSSEHRQFNRSLVTGKVRSAQRSKQLFKVRQTIARPSPVNSRADQCAGEIARAAEISSRN